MASGMHDWSYGAHIGERVAAHARHARDGAHAEHHQRRQQHQLELAGVVGGPTASVSTPSHSRQASGGSGGSSLHAQSVSLTTVGLVPPALLPPMQSDVDATAASSLSTRGSVAVHAHAASSTTVDAAAAARSVGAVD